METDEISFWSGRVFEYIWGYLFTGSLDILQEKKLG